MNINKYNSKQKPNKKGSFRYDIQGLRAIAVIAVVFYHINDNWIPGGFVGVDIFLVISGFLITSIILNKKHNNSFSFIIFYSKRIKRILPAYLVLLTIVSLLSAILLTPNDFAFFKSSLWHSLLFLSNQYFATFGNYFAPRSNELLLLHTWSLAVEMQFYFLLPFLLMLLKIKYLKIAIPVFLVLITFYTNYQITIRGEHQAMFYSLVGRMPGLLIGSWLAITNLNFNENQKFKNNISWVGLIIVAGSLIFINEKVPFPGLLILPPCIGTAIIIATDQTTISKLLSNKILVWIGAISYSLYLWHWPILANIRYYLGKDEISSGILIIYLCLIFIIAYLSYQFIEIPFRKPSISIRDNSLRIITGFLCVGIIYLSTFKLNQSLFNPLPVEYTRYAPPNSICHGKIIDDCLRGIKKKNTDFLLLGDSHAAQLNYASDKIGKINNQAIQVITASQCVTIPGFKVENLPKYAKEKCLSQIKIAENIIQRSNNIIIAGSWAGQLKLDRTFLNTLNKFLDYTDSNNKEVIVLAQIPALSANVRRFERFKKLGLPAYVSLGAEWIDANKVIENTVLNHSSARFLNLSNSHLFKTVPFYNGEMIYHDRIHLNQKGSLLYGEVLAPYFRDF